jgi:L-fuculose-phosphate aldolase
MMPSVEAEIAEVNQLLYARGLNTSRDGNISVRQGGRIYMTPTKYRGPVGNAGLTADSIVSWPESAPPPPEVEARVSTEWQHHVRVFSQAPDVGAIVHCHAPHATALASSPDWRRHLRRLGAFSEFKLYDRLPLVFSTEAIIPDDPQVATAHSVICRFHGVTTFGRDLTQAFERVERLEFYARVALLSGR